MIIPSSIQPIQGTGFLIKEEEEGLFTVKNAYEGDYQYFKNRPVQIETSSAERNLSSSTGKKDNLEKT